MTTYTYNLFGETTGIDYSDGTPDVSYSYNRVGRLSQVTDAVGTRTFAYNSTFDEISETITGLYSKTLTRTYTSTGFKGKKQGLSIDNVSHYTYGYDIYGRMNQVTIPSGSFNYTRMANSDLVSQMTRPNGITTTWSYETNRDLITQVQNGAVSTYGYVNDAIGRRTSMSRSGSAYANPDTIAYTYNDRSELTGALSNVDTTNSYSYVYDPIGNRVTASEAGVPWTYTTNNLNQYVSATENNVQLSFSYDLDGSMTYRPVDATSGWTQTWNGENRMVETHRGTDRLTFKYDYMGRRVEKCVYSGNTLTSKALFVYDGFKCVEELNGLDNNTVAMRHTWQSAKVGLDVIIATTDANGLSYYLHDANKNIVQKSNNSIIINSSNILFYSINNNSSIRFVFSSESSDSELLLIYYTYRYLVPSTGRWMSREPLGENIGLSLYTYINNNFVNTTDSNGLMYDLGVIFPGAFDGPGVPPSRYLPEYMPPYDCEKAYVYARSKLKTKEELLAWDRYTLHDISGTDILVPSGEVKKIVDNLSGVKQFVENARSKCKKCKTFSDAKPFSGKAISPWELAIGGLSADVSVSCMKGCFSYSYTINDYYDFDWHGNWLGLGSDRGGFFNELAVRGISILEPICGWKKFYHKGVYQETCQ